MSWRAVLVVLAACGDNAGTNQILFIRGGAGTAGFVEGGTDDHLSDIFDSSTEPFSRGYGHLAALLRGENFAVEQVIEGPVTAPAPIDLGGIGLSRYAVVVFGSNNAVYNATDAALVAGYVRDGGGLLFMSDANWGTDWDKAPNSDQTFLTQFGLVMNQDGGGVVTIGVDDFFVPDHPIFAGVDSFQGEGTSPCSLSHDPLALATPILLAPTKGVVRRNSGVPGPVEDSTENDASLTVVEYGRGRIACHFDRNTFFNENGAGTSLAGGANATYARNLFLWLARRD